MSRLLAYGVGLGLVAVVAAPGLSASTADSYPLSTYPMFARARGKPWLDFVEAVDAHGKVSALAPALIASDEVMQAAATVRRAVQSGPPALGPFCAGVAERVAASENAAVVELRIVGARFDPLRYFVVGPEPEERLVHWTCAVPARAPRTP